MIIAEYGGQKYAFPSGTNAIEQMLYIIWWDYEDTGDEILAKTWERLQTIKLVHHTQYMWVENEQAYMDEYIVPIDDARQIIFRFQA